MVYLSFLWGDIFWGEEYIRRIPPVNFSLKTHGAYLGFALTPKFSLPNPRVQFHPPYRMPCEAREGG